MATHATLLSSRTLTSCVLMLLMAVLSACGAAGGMMLPATVEVRQSMAADLGPESLENTEQYTDYGVNPWTDTAKDNLSTFAIDVDTGSYTIARRKLNEGRLPPIEAVRVEEFVNAFPYNYSQPDGAVPFAVHAEVAPSPVTKGVDILRVGIQGENVPEGERQPANLVFLVDVSGSMRSSDKLGLAQDALIYLVDQLDARDRVALVTYAGSTRVVLESTSIAEREVIVNAIANLAARGSTAMSSGLQLAYEQALKNMAPGSVNRVIVVSDGDANVGRTNHSDMIKSIRHHINEGVTVSAIGVGMGNYKDTTMEQLANLGNGNYYYLDNFEQAKKIFGTQLNATLQVIARDVKIQVAFNPETVARYRLVGYENRDVADDDFRVDAVDGGEIGSGHQVTALYELQRVPGAQGPLGDIHIRHKDPDHAKGEQATENKYPLTSSIVRDSFAGASEDLRFAVAIVAFAEILRDSPGAKGWTMAMVRDIAANAAGVNAERRAVLELIDRAANLQAAL